MSILKPIIYSGEGPDNTPKATSPKIQDMKSPTRAHIEAVPDSYHVFALPVLFAWCTISVRPIGGPCNVMFTISSPQSIAAGTAIWHEWDHGEVDTDAWHEWENPWAAVRIDCTSSAIVEIAAKY